MAQNLEKYKTEFGDVNKVIQFHSINTCLCSLHFSKKYSITNQINNKILIS